MIRVQWVRDPAPMSGKFRETHVIWCETEDGHKALKQAINSDARTVAQIGIEVDA